MPTLCEIERNSGISVLRRAAARIASVSQIEPLSVNTRHAQTLSGAAAHRAYQHLSGLGTAHDLWDNALHSPSI